jgi:hypothetical protein
LARPGGHATGFMLFEYSLSGKWLELLKELAPRVARAGILRDSNSPGGIGQYAAIQAVAPSIGLEANPIEVRDANEIERAIAAFAGSANGGLIVTSSALAVAHRKLIVALAARHRLPAVYAFRYYATSGGLISYGPDTTDPFRRAAGYIDRILKGEKPADLPVQLPTKYEGASSSRCSPARRRGRSRGGRNSRRCPWSDFSILARRSQTPACSRHSERALPRPATQRARMSRSNSAGRTVKIAAWGKWRPTWCSVR